MRLHRTRSAFLLFLSAVLLAPGPFASGQWGDSAVLAGEGALGDTPRGAAEARYGRDRLEARPVHLPGFSEAFAGLELFDVYDRSMHPTIMHRMAWNPATQSGYDVTEDFNDLMALTGALLGSRQEALDYAFAYAESANVEIEPLRQFLTERDSVWLSQVVADPAARLKGASWVVTLSTWAQAQGVLADWTIQFDANRVQFGEWLVRDIGVGPFYFDLHGEISSPGFLVHNAYAAGSSERGLYDVSGATRTLLREPTPLLAAAAGSPSTTFTNYDGSKWVVQYATSNVLNASDPVLWDGDALAKGGVDAYGSETRRNANDAADDCFDTPNPNPDGLGYESKDPDCKLQIFVHNGHLAGFATTDPGLDVLISVPGSFKARMHALGLYQDPTRHTNYSMARAIMSHEHAHNLQFAANGWHPDWGGWKEGQASVIPALVDPEGEYDPTSLLGKAFNQYQDNVGQTAGLCEVPSYDATLFWAVLYAKNGGMEAYHRVMSDLRAKALSSILGGGVNDNDTLACRAWMPEAITTSLTYLKGLHPENAHSDFNDTHRDLALASFSRNLTFGPPNGTVRNWGNIMSPRLAPSRTVESVHSAIVRPLGEYYVGVQSDGVYNVTVSGAVNDRWKVLLMQRCADGSVLDSDIEVGVRTQVTSRACDGAEDMLAILHPYRAQETVTVALEE